MTHETHWVTEALRRHQAGDEAASRDIVEFAYPILAGYALRVLRGQAVAASDEEDVANSSLKALFCDLGDAKWPRSSDDLTRLLLTVAWRKINDRRKRAAEKHGDRASGGDQNQATLSLLADGRTPPDLAELADEVRESKAALARHDPVMVRILEGQLEERTNEEIAATIGLSLATVKRKIQRSREILRGEVFDGRGA